MDVTATSYDAIDRVTAKYGYLPGTSTVESATDSYDGAGANGLLTQKCDALSECANRVYDGIGRLSSITYAGDGGVTPARTYGYDADGRTISISSVSSFGTQGYAYDADGREIQSAEPIGGGVTDPSTLTYSYYPNGWRQSLSVAPEQGSGLNQQNLLTYLYQADGKLATEFVNYGGSVNKFGFTYTAAGRELTMSDPYYAAAHTYSYDNFDRPSSYSIPQGTYTGYTYDTEGETKSFTAYGGVPVVRYYSDRGELAAETISASASPQAWPQYSTSYADGVPFGQIDKTGSQGSALNGFDARSGAMLPLYWTLYQAYDGAGREVETQDDYQFCSKPDGCSEFGGTNTRQYDADNHLISGQYNLWNAWSIAPLACGFRDASGSTGVPTSRAVAYKWGPNGHPAMLAANQSGTTAPAASTYETLHWDADTLLFTSNASGQIDDIKVGSLADIVPVGAYTGITVWDREPNGMVTSEHNSTGYGSWSPPHPYRQPCIPAAAPSPSPSTFTYAAPRVAEPAGDGIFDGYNDIQGARTFDPGTGAWTSPDAFSGVTSDPTSQLSYVYDGNNPLKYSDPSGFVIRAMGGGLGMALGQWIEIYTVESKQDDSTIDDGRDQTNNKERDQKEAASADAQGAYVQGLSDAGHTTGTDYSNPQSNTDTGYLDRASTDINGHLQTMYNESCHSSGGCNEYIKDYMVHREGSELVSNVPGLGYIWIDPAAHPSKNEFANWGANSILFQENYPGRSLPVERLDMSSPIGPRLGIAPTTGNGYLLTTVGNY